MSSLLGSVLGLLSVALLLGMLIWSGRRDDDQVGDAAPRARVEQALQPGDPRRYARVDVDNPNDSPVLVRARTRPATGLRALLDTRPRRRTLTRCRPEPGGLTLLGGADGRGAGAWLFPLESSTRGAVRVQVLVHQVAGRSRLHTYTLAIPAVAYPDLSSPLTGRTPSGSGRRTPEAKEPTSCGTEPGGSARPNTVEPPADR